MPRFLRCAALLTITLVSWSVNSAQPVRITTKTVKYTRTGRDIPDFKQTFEVRYPIITGLPPAIKREIERQLNYWRVFKMSQRESLREETWLESFDYETKYNDNNLLAIWLTAEGSGAYPDSSRKYIVLDTRTGKRLTLRDLFTATKLTSLRNAIRQKMRASEAGLDADEGPELKTHRQDEIYNKYHPVPSGSS